MRLFQPLNKILSIEQKGSIKDDISRIEASETGSSKIDLTDLLHHSNESGFPVIFKRKISI